MSIPRQLVVAMFFFLAAVGIVGCAHKADDIVVNQKALPEDMTARQALKVAKKANADIEDHFAERMAEETKKLKAAISALQPLQSNLEKLGKTDKEYQAFLEKVHAITNDKLEEDRAKIMNENFAKARKMLDRVYTKAGGDPKKDNAAVLAIYRDYIVLPDSMLAFLLRRLEETAGPITAEITFEAPFALSDAETDKGTGLTEVHAEISNNDGTMELSAEATGAVFVPAYCHANAKVGEFFDVPAGKSQIRMDVRYEYEYRAAVWSSGGGSFANLSAMVTLHAASNSLEVARAVFDGESLSSIVVGYGEETNDETNVVTLTADVVPGGRYLVQFSAYVSANGQGLAGAGSFVTLTPIAIDIEFLD